MTDDLLWRTALITCGVVGGAVAQDLVGTFWTVWVTVVVLLLVLVVREP